MQQQYGHAPIVCTCFNSLVLYGNSLTMLNWLVHVAILWPCCNSLTMLKYFDHAVRV
jgi:hypothetical protein